jgi:hypothetical protein
LTIEGDDKDEQTYGAPQAEPDTPHPCAHREHADEHEKFEN